MSKASKSELFVAALSEMLVTRGLPRLSEDESVVLGDAFMEAVNEEVEERERLARRDDW
jgi:hypothetical protein